MAPGELVETQEDEGIRFKEVKNRFDFREALHYRCAFLNYDGRKLVFGTSDKHPKQVVGSQVFEQPGCTRRGLVDKLHIVINFQVYEHKGKRILVLEITGWLVGLPV